MSLTVAFRAGGDVAPCRFVTLSASAFTIQAATANQPPIGVSFSGTREAPVPSASPLLAIAGEGCPIWGPGETALLELGGTVTTGALLKSDASGKGVAIAASGTDLQRYGAVALEPGAAGERIRVLIQPGVLRPALT
jgi:hypothetical protein